MSKHTPGPWRIDMPHSPLDQIAVVTNEHEHGNVQTLTVAELCTNEADARLIAAAPDLLAALREAQACLVMAHEGIVHGQRWERAIQANAAALAKVEG